MEKNLYGILKDAPDGLVMYSRAHGQVRVYKRDISRNPECTKAFRLEPNLPFGGTIGYLDMYGRILPGGECILFPNANCDWDNWQDCLMIQSPCFGRIIYCEEEDKLYQISGLNTARDTQGHVKLAPWFKGCRFADEYEREQFYQLTKQSVMNQLLKQTKPGDLVLVRKQWTSTDKVWRLGHFSHISKETGHYVTTEIAATGTGNYYQYLECLPFSDMTKDLIDTDIDPTVIRLDADIEIREYTDK